MLWPVAFDVAERRSLPQVALWSYNGNSWQNTRVGSILLPPNFQINSEESWLDHGTIVAQKCMDSRLGTVNLEMLAEFAFSWWAWRP